MPGLVDAGQHLLNDLLRQAGLLAQLGCPSPGLAVQGDEGGILRLERRHLLGLAHDGLEVAVLLGVVNGDAALLAVSSSCMPASPRCSWPIRAMVPMV